MDFKQRKQKRIEHFEKNVKGWKQRPCLACNGSGYYDHNGSPKCGSCRGTGKEMYKSDSIKKHDKVVLNSGGPIMTVIDVRGNEIECTWNNGSQCAIFYLWTLTKINGNITNKK